MSLRKNSQRKSSSFLLSDYVNNTARIKIAQELHDGIAQDLVGLGYVVDTLISGEANEGQRSELRSLRFDLTRLIEKVRGEILHLRTPNVSDIALNSTPDMQLALKRIVDEIIANSTKHSRATSIEISIKDNGIGGAEAKEQHHGIAGIIERAAEIGAEVTFDSTFQGTAVTITVALQSQ